ncbi:DUF1837 domain-containing protein [Xanthomonas protegens]|uniref:DUF1837 domain-containing protein n=1 Tax=Xanthomonas protegens TaxID=3380705 RepID=A0ABU9LHS2_9XANT
MKIPLSLPEKFLSANKEKLESLITSVEHEEQIDGLTAVTHMKFLKFDGNGIPLIKALAELMFQHAIDYCLNARDRPAQLTAQDSMRISKAARKLFVHPPATDEDPDQTGEAGELLLYILIEAILGAPQVVAKMELKTNPSLEVNGSDGIHMTWSESDGLVDVYFGESKIYQDLGAALAAAIKSIDSFHEEDILRHEFLLVTKQFKYAHPEVQDFVTNLMSDGTPHTGIRINHACLIGYNWKEYERILKFPAANRLAEIQEKYAADAGRVHDICRNKLASFKNRHLRLVFFFLPFEKVQDFRDAFNAAMD